MKKLLILSLLLTLVSCNEQSLRIRGTLDVTTPIELIASDDTTGTILAGTYNAKISVRSRKEVVLRANDQKFKFKSTEAIINNSGEYQIPAESLNQPYDLDVLADQTVTRTETSSRYESCMVFNHGNPPYHPPTSTFGKKIVYYHDIITKTDLNFDMLSPETGEVVANFAGTNTSSRMVIEFEGHCF